MLTCHHGRKHTSVSLHYTDDPNKRLDANSIVAGHGPLKPRGSEYLTPRLEAIL